MSKKMIKCKTCGAEIAKNAKACPQCGGKNKKKLPVWAAILIIIVVFVTSILCSSILDSAPSETDTPSGAATGLNDDTTPPVASDSVLGENDLIKVTFVKAYEETFVDGAFYLALKVENKTEKTIWVSLTDSSVNDEMCMAMSGVPMVIAPGKSSSSPFFFSYSNLSISSIEEVQNIEFRVTVADNDTMSTLGQTDPLRIDF